MHVIPGRRRCSHTHKQGLGKGAPPQRLSVSGRLTSLQPQALLRCLLLTWLMLSSTVALQGHGIAVSRAMALLIYSPKAKPSLRWPPSLTSWSCLAGGTTRPRSRS